MQLRREGSKGAFVLPAMPWRAVWVAFLIRIAYMTLAHTYRFRQILFEGNFQFGFEMGRIGRALASGYGFADPFSGHTGPTAWVGPLYPLLIGGIFKLLGIYTLKSAWVLLAINCILSAMIVLPVWEIASRCFDRRVALWSAWIWALYPAAMQYAVRWVWEMTLTTLLFSWVLVLALRMRNIGGEASEADHALTRRRWACFGILWGLIALSNASLLAFLPFCGLWILAGTRILRRQIAGVAISSVLCLACIAPWTYRNWLVFHEFVPLRGNFGAELYLGNGPGAVGLLMGYDHPNEATDQLALYRQMGEISYSKYRGRLAMTTIAGNPGRFAVLCFRRVYYFWAGAPHPQGSFVAEYGRNLNFAFTSLAGLLGLGLALGRRKPAAMLFAFAFLLLPGVYYLITVHARFRHPLEPLITILGVYLFHSAKPRAHASNGLREDISPSSGRESAVKLAFPYDSAVKSIDPGSDHLYTY